MKWNNQLKRLGSLLLCAALTAGLLAPAAWADESVVHIRSRMDWEQLIQNCRLDTWSQGKTVLLECDLDLIGASAVPTFGGVFDGGGHTIRGLKLSNEGDHQGLFRYVQEGGTIKNLTVSGVVSPEGTCSSVGGIAGVNSGTITQCQYQGAVDGTDQIGGIAGINEPSGTIINCAAEGSITGEHYTGGITGENYGSVVQCTNRAQVNTKRANISPELDEVNWEHLNSTENVPACTDTGGIAGYSKGVIQSCVNRGDVGYPHTGYNVGGIVGRQSGYVDGCTNYGAVQGRKEVGGVAGQMEPYTLLKFEEDTLHALLDELDVLNGILNRTMDDADQSRHQLSEQLTAVSELTNSARKDATGMLDDVKDLGEGTIDTVNDLSARISKVIDQSVPVVEDMQAMSESLSRAISQLEEGLEKLESASGDGNSAVAELRRAITALKGASDQVDRALTRIRNAVSALKNALGSNEEVKSALEELAAGMADLKTGLDSTSTAVRQLIGAMGGIENLPNWGEIDPDDLTAELEAVSKALDTMGQAVQNIHAALKRAAGAWKDDIKEDAQLFRQTVQTIAAGLKDIAASGAGISGALEHIQKMGPFLDGVQAALLEASESIRDGMWELSDGAGDMASALERLRDILEELSEEPELVFPKLDSSFHEKEARLDGTLDCLADQMEQINQIVEQAGDQLSGNIKGISSQFQTITDLLRDAQENSGEDEDHLVDVSEEDAADITLGKVSGCVNYGSVDGDVNIGGLTGSMSIEFDFDPEDDITSQGSSSLNFQYLTRAVLYDGINYGTVTARKNGAGGIVGRMGLGLLLSCQGYGDVKSTRGEYVGGIAGISYAAIRNSWAKCSLTGNKYVGGIAGFGTDISACRALVEISEGTAYIGAIAGEMDGVLEENYFVSETLGGVDGVSYFRKAQPLSYSELMQMEHVPAAFESFQVTFTAQGETVAVVPFQYGKALSREQLPQVPEREGFYGLWEDFTWDAPKFDAVVEAVYSPWLTTISSEDGKILAEGNFTQESVLRKTDSSQQPPHLAGQEEVYGQWQVEIQQAQEFTALRIWVPEEGGKAASVWVYTQQGAWEKQPAVREGSFLRVELSGQSAVLCVTQSPARGILWLGLLCAAVLAAGLALIAKKREKHKKAQHKAAAGK